MERERHEVGWEAATEILAQGYLRALRAGALAQGVTQPTGRRDIPVRERQQKERESA